MKKKAKAPSRKKPPAKRGSRRQVDKIGEGSRTDWLNANLYTILMHTIGDLDDLQEMCESSKICSVEERQNHSFVMLSIPGFSHEVCSVVSFTDPASPEVVGGYVYKKKGKWTLTFFASHYKPGYLPDTYLPQ